MRPRRKIMHFMLLANIDDIPTQNKQRCKTTSRHLLRRSEGKSSIGSIANIKIVKNE